MRKNQKRQLLDLIVLLDQAHEEIKRSIETNPALALELLSQCQEGAVKIGDMIEMTEGEGFQTIPLLEAYCELAYQIYEAVSGGLDINANRAYKQMRKALIQVENSVKYDVKVRLEAVFLPYKASMWDSLESIWQAADADPDCDAYVIPIPYYDKNPDGSMGMYHYEGDSMPSYVPITHYGSYDLEDRKPDIIYIHNPYDHTNYVTSVDPRYYSYELKKYTDSLVYVPYYVTAGGMEPSQASCSAYYHVDYIVIQADGFQKFFDSSIPAKKFLPLGSPKIDRVIRFCENPPTAPVEWQKKMAGKKVYFYNTSIGGMLADTGKFLMKMEYVFKCFEGRDDACLLWRPHPLMESTFDSMRKEYRSVYNRLKRYFIQNDLGIYDDTPDIEKTIALCDSYIGDAGTSVTALFGAAGKPIFILNNRMCTQPGEDDWREEIIQPFVWQGNDDWMVTQGNKLYHAPNHDYKYEFYCDLSEYTGGDYYLNKVMEFDGDIYICPANAQEILVLKEHKIQKKVALIHCLDQAGAFLDGLRIKHYLFLIPNKYPAIVRYDTRNNHVDYIDGYNDFLVENVCGEGRVGGYCTWDSYLLLASPKEDKILAIDSETLKIKVLTTGSKVECGWKGAITYDNGICMLPFTGADIVCWNPDDASVIKYDAMVEGLRCENRFTGLKCMDRAFSIPAIWSHKIILPPCWANFFVSIDMESGKAERWKLPINEQDSKSITGPFLRETNTLGEGTFRWFSYLEQKLYDINIKTLEYKEIKIRFSKEELLKYQSGFGLESEWMKYCCRESALYPLKDYLDGAVVGNGFDKEKQLLSYRTIFANNDGSCGKTIYQFAKDKVNT